MATTATSRRAYYDPKQPRLLTDGEIGGLTAEECDVACLQIDQILVSILQNIDADFGRSHRIITDKILPNLERYGEASKGIWEGLKFWQNFFEASVNVKLSGDDNEETTEAGISMNHEDQTNEVDSDTSIETIQQKTEKIKNKNFNQQTTNSNSNSNSNFDTLTKQDLHEGIMTSTKELNKPTIDVTQLLVNNDNSHQTGSSESLRRPPHWHDLSLDSPDTTLQIPIPQDLSLLIDSQSGNSLDSDFSISSSTFPSKKQQEEELEEENKVETTSQLRPRKDPTRSGNKNYKLLLHQALLRDTMSGNHKRQTISTPAKPISRIESLSRRGSLAGCLPPEMASPHWNGLTDLRKVPLDGLMGSKKPTRKIGISEISKQVKDDGEEEDDQSSLRAGISSPQIIHFSVPRSRLAQTPSKEAARLVTRDVLETARLRAGYANPIDLEDSPPLEPPSVLREWKQRGYESLFKSRSDLDSNHDSFSSIGHLNPIHAGPSRDTSSSVSKALIDLREEDLQSAKQSKKSLPLVSERDDPFSEKSSARSRHQPTTSTIATTSRLASMPTSNTTAFDQSTDSVPDSPTLFGLRPPSNPSASHLNHNHNSANQNHPFVPLRPDNLDTFFGGDLLDSDCFHPSPLHGKRIKYSNNNNNNDHNNNNNDHTKKN